MKRFLLRTSTLLLFSWLAISFNLLWAQEGNPYLTHFKLPNHISNQNWRFEQGNNGLMFVLNQKGVFAFDGNTWDNLNVPGRPITIKFFGENLFFCSDRGVGRFVKQPTGQYTAEIILEAKNSDYFYKLATLNEKLFVVSPQLICGIAEEGQVKFDTFYHETYREVFISDIFPVNGELYHVKNRSLVYRPKPDGGFEMVDGLPLGEDFVFSTIHQDGVILGSTASMVYQFNGKNLSKIQLKDQEYLSASQLNGGISVDSTILALSTLNGGCVIVNLREGNTLTTLNLSQGLPDDEVYALGKDHDGGLWISHAMGITRADMRIPVSSFNYYPGLKGNIFSAIEQNGKLYVGCSDGLYILSEFRDYKAVEVTIGRKKFPQKKETPKVIEKEEKQEPTIEKKKSNFLSRLFARKSSSEPDDEMVKRSGEEKQVAAQEATRVSPVKKKIYQLQSVSHSFKKITGIESKVKQQIVFGDRLIVATSSGVFEVADEKVAPILSGVYSFYIQQAFHNENVFFLTCDRGIYSVQKSGASWKKQLVFEGDNQHFTSIVDVSNDMLIATSEFGVVLLKKEGSIFKVTGINSEDITLESPIVRMANGAVYVFTPSKVYRFNSENEKLEVDPAFHVQPNYSIVFSQKDYSWIKEGIDWNLLASTENVSIAESPYINLFENPTSFYISSSTIYVVDDYSKVYRVSLPKAGVEERQPSIFLKEVVGSEGNILLPDAIKLNYSENSLKIRISAPYYLQEGAISYQYSISGLSAGWSEWEAVQTIDFPYLPAGKYSIRVRARDVLGNVSDILEIPYEVTPPFWRRPLFIVACAILLIVLLVIVVVLRERKLKREKRVLEEKVRERTQIIEEQNITLTLQRDDLERYNKEITQQKEEITAQRDEIEAQRDQIFKQNEEITNSIVYARRIQSAIMPSADVVGSLLKSCFIMFRPRDIVSGDFYWMSKIGDKTIVVAADCTGHGVPGAFMSMMGVSFLNDIVGVEGVTSSEIILNMLREKIKATLWQTGKEGETRDGMDIAICVFEKDFRTVHYSGAYNPLYLVRKGELIEYKADKMPVGIHVKEKESFTINTVSLEKGDNLYIFSDGYVSQFGGDDGKKFMAKPFKELLVSINGKSMEEQKHMIEQSLDKWQGHHDQVDDVLVIGIEIV